MKAAALARVVAQRLQAALVLWPARNARYAYTYAVEYAQFQDHEFARAMARLAVRPRVRSPWA